MTKSNGGILQFLATQKFQRPTSVHSIHFQYVDALIGPNTMNTIPDSTLANFLDHGTVARTLDADVDEAKAVLAAKFA